ncbi:MAG: restriction endonuclease [Methanosarcina sp.]
MSVIRSANDSNGTTQDPLGLISFIQEKRWEKTVLRPGVHRFTEALIGNKEKGFFMTNLNFSKRD